MTKITVLLLAFVLVAVSAATLYFLSKPQPPVRLSSVDAGSNSISGRPNIVLIVLDTARADSVSLTGSARMTTPNLEALARDSVVYRQAHSVAPWTLPAHGSMFTGLLPGQHGATWRAFGSPEDATLRDILSQTFSFPEPERLLAANLNAIGFTTIAFSSNAWISKRTGFDHGFDTFYEVWKEGDSHRGEFRFIPNILRWSGYLPLETAVISELDYGDAGKALKLFDAHVNVHGLPEPFFLFFNFIDPHFPYSPPPSWRYAFSKDAELGERIARFEFDELAMAAGDRPIDVSRFRPFYEAELLYLDTVVGRLIAWLQRRELYDETLIVVVSDHGEHLGERGHFSHQFSVGEELLKVPLLIKYPGGDQAGRVVDDPRVSNLDVYETILHAGRGKAVEGSEEVPSRNLGSMEAFDRDFLIAEYYHSVPYLRTSQTQYPAFDFTSERVDRRVVFDGEARYEFVEPVGGRLKFVPSAGGAAPGGQKSDAALAALERYIGSLDSTVLVPSESTPDEETFERLRSLGYVR